MFPSSSSITALAKTHPHSAEALNFFVPLVRAQKTCLKKNNLITLPKANKSNFQQGKPLFMATELPYTDSFLKNSITSLVNAVTKVLPEHKNSLDELKKFLRTNLVECKAMLNYRLAGNTTKIEAWAKAHKLNVPSVGLVSMLLSGTIAQSVRQKVVQEPLPEWEKGYCPVCGSPPQGSMLKETEGKRFLHCTLCSHEWQYNRTACPACENGDVKKISLFFFEGRTEERAEGCNACQQYILSLDTRKLAHSDIPAELYFLCMAPLDFMLQEKGYAPVSASMFR